MAIDLSAESLLTLRQAAKSLPGKLHVATLHRWRLRGVRGVKLESILVGGIRYTSEEALQRFADALTAQTDGHTSPAVRSQKQRASAIARAERELEAATA
jgi:regulator of protease activity HflC (stomatin/prohibitin superfamily)